MMSGVIPSVVLALFGSIFEWFRSAFTLFRFPRRAATKRPAVDKVDVYST